MKRLYKWLDTYDEFLLTFYERMAESVANKTFTAEKQEGLYWELVSKSLAYLNGAEYECKELGYANCYYDKFVDEVSKYERIFNQVGKQFIQK